MERSPGASLVERASAPSDPPARPPGAHTQRDRTSGNQPAGPGAAAEALALLTSFGRRLLVLVPVYLAGAVGLSVGFVLFGLALYLGWRRVRDGKERSLRAARQLLDDEERLTAQTLYLSHRELPAWVSERPAAGVSLQARGPLPTLAAREHPPPRRPPSPGTEQTPLAARPDPGLSTASVLLPRRQDRRWEPLGSRARPGRPPQPSRPSAPRCSRTARGAPRAPSSLPSSCRLFSVLSSFAV